MAEHKEVELAIADAPKKIWLNIRGNAGLLFRGSINGKCVRFHETADTKGNPDAKEAIDQSRTKHE